MKAYIVDNSSFYIEQIRKLLREYEVFVRGFDRIEYTEIEPGSLVILSGGHLYKVNWHDKVYAREIELIRKHNGPIIGICLGAQLIAHVYGERLHQLKENREGIVTIRPIKDGLRPLEVPETIEVYENHHFSIEKLHAPLVSLAVSDDGVESIPTCEETYFWNSVSSRSYEE